MAMMGGDKNRAKLVLAVLFLVVVVVTGVEGRRHRGILVGARSEVKDVKSNKEIQELGRFSVAEFNYQQKQRILMKPRGGNEEEKQKLLMFEEVVGAERQVVSGIKYYLKIQTTVTHESSSDENSNAKVYDAVVVVKPWLGHRQLLHFTPSSPATGFSAN